MDGGEQPQHNQDHRHLGEADADYPADRLGLALGDLQFETVADFFDRPFETDLEPIDLVVEGNDFALKVGPDAFDPVFEIGPSGVEFVVEIGDRRFKANNIALCRGAGLGKFGERLDLGFGEAGPLQLEDRKVTAMMTERRVGEKSLGA